MIRGIISFCNVLYYDTIFIMQDTPAMSQYRKLKSENPDVILLYRMGDFYETFDEDAKTISRVLNITLTSRDKTSRKTPMAGFPYHALENYLSKLIENDFKVAICEQLEDPKTVKGVVKRGIIKIVTPGTYISDSSSVSKENNFIVAIKNLPNNQYCLSFIDFSTGDFYITGILSYDSLVSFLYNINPSEIIIPEDFELNFKKDFVLSISTSFNRKYAINYVDEIDENDISLEPAGAIIDYLKKTQLSEINHIKKIKRFDIKEYMVLDENTLRSLEIFGTINNSSYKGSLLSVIDFTKTSMGGRKLRFFISHPLLNESIINKRLDAVSELQKSNIKDISILLESIYDIERICARIGTISINPRDLIALKISLEKVFQLNEYLKIFKSDLLKEIYLNIFNLEKLRELYDIIDINIEDDPPLLIKDGGFIKKGINEELDKLKRISKEGKDWILNFQGKEQKRLGISSLKVHYNKVFGYYIEISNSNKDKVPQDYIRKQTLANAERYISSELKEYEDLIINSQTRSIILENQIFSEIRENIKNYITYIQILSENIAYFDVLLSFAESSINLGLSRPDISENDFDISIKDARHLVIESVIRPQVYIPNDIELTKEKYIMVISGPNMSGKSSILRQTALIIILAQIGSFVPAKEAHISIVDRVFTRVGASDNLSLGESTFMVEMKEVSNILNNATKRSFIILDEVGRGTSTFDGVSIAWAIIEYIHNDIKAKTMIATHYNELIVLEDILSGVFNVSVMVKENNRDIIFLRKLQIGGTDKSYGIHVAKLADLPESTIKRAYEVLEDFELGKNKTVVIQQDLFEKEENTLAEDLKNIDIDNITAIEAFKILMDLKEKYD